MYYLQSRYYDPEIGRFLNADILISTGQGLLSNNMFVYCLNTPIALVDPSGMCSYKSSLCGWVDCGDWRCPRSSAEMSTSDYFSIPNRETHYSRNQYNPDFPEYYDEEFFEGWDDSVAANCHQFTTKNRDNVKYVSPDGMYEVIYDVNGNIVTDSRDVGTYNYISPNEDGFGHILQDVVPWIIHGNSSDDSTTWYERLLSLAKIYI